MSAIFVGSTSAANPAKLPRKRDAPARARLYVAARPRLRLLNRNEGLDLFFMLMSKGVSIA
jgi:hypothetical protein